MYSFWRFDDFSWGNTRVVLGDDGKSAAVADDDDDFEIDIPLVKWNEIGHTPDPHKPL